MMLPDAISNRESRACDLGAIPPEDRRRYQELRLRLSDSLNAAKELKGAFVFEFCSEHLSPDELSEWIELERICCPWISIRLGKTLEQMIDLHMSIPDGSKEAIRAEFSDWLQSQRNQEVIK